MITKIIIFFIVVFIIAVITAPIDWTDHDEYLRDIEE